MAEETKEEVKPIELGEFAVNANNDNGTELRLGNEKKGATLVIRNRSVGRDMLRGAKYAVTLTLVEGAEEAEMVTAEVPADKVSELPKGSEIVRKPKK